MDSKKMMAVLAITVLAIPVVFSGCGKIDAPTVDEPVDDIVVETQTNTEVNDTIEDDLSDMGIEVDVPEVEEEHLVQESDTTTTTTNSQTTTDNPLAGLPPLSPEPVSPQTEQSILEKYGFDNAGNYDPSQDEEYVFGQGDYSDIPDHTVQ